MPDLGSGLSLDEQWDLYVDESSGDVAFEEASEEVQKDLAFILARALKPVVGEFIDEGGAADIRLRVRKLILSDDRIDTVDEVEVIPDTDGDRLDIDVTATTVTGVEIDNVFTVG